MVITPKQVRQAGGLIPLILLELPKIEGWDRSFVAHLVIENKKKNAT